MEAAFENSSQPEGGRKGEPVRPLHSSTVSMLCVRLLALEGRTEATFLRVGKIQAEEDAVGVPGSGSSAEGPGIGLDRERA